jgi:hypothetical protein
LQAQSSDTVVGLSSAPIPECRSENRGAGLGVPHGVPYAGEVEIHEQYKQYLRGVDVEQLKIPSPKRYLAVSQSNIRIDGILFQMRGFIISGQFPERLHNLITEIVSSEAPVARDQFLDQLNLTKEQKIYARLFKQANHVDDKVNELQYYHLINYCQLALFQERHEQVISLMFAFIILTLGYIVFRTGLSAVAFLEALPEFVFADSRSRGQQHRHYADYVLDGSKFLLLVMAGMYQYHN